ncbi:signal peptidase I [Mechercharimyces sp. CAU 1602]|uniref:signal peptidase I n=1 Tax=Mechercharimyces sp. CAU 1602 TaxID=2973933 RepID=UPI0021621B51|nr:signal peptidase I [Mechercharimyces sp. CAU 1602]MCS1351352.1 signal peptidase I [Mechercharimyces sp. CAU 1602]
MSEDISRSQRKKERNQRETREWAYAILIAVVLFFVIRIFIFQPFNVSGPSMQETLYTKDKVMVNKLLYRFQEPERGDVVVLHAPEPEDAGKEFIKRVIAVAGETVSAENNHIYINGERIEEDYIPDTKRVNDFGPVAVPDGSVFVIGDNRINSKDSREFGPVETDHIVGRAEVIFWPFDRIELLW